MPTTKAVLFDMGGVLVELGPLDELLGLTMASDELWPRWLSSEAVRRFERGQCTNTEFARGLRAEFELPLTVADVLERIRGFPRGLYDGARELVADLVDGLVTGVLSNTNQLHWDHQIDAETIQQMFDHQFLSYRLGLVKPDAAIFQRVVADLGLAPSEVLFIDDNQLNVDGARTVGLDAHQAQGVIAARQLLTERGLIRAG